MIAAINELMALLTPARWGYEDIELPSQLSEGRLGVGIALGNGSEAVRAELHLNTAELNLFTISLFLLCTVRVTKPLGLIVFDDPLQNMDELTSTALARGLAKLICLLKSLGRTEEFLLLFHGYDDVERFQREISASTYRLPWLSPGPGALEITIECEHICPSGSEGQRLGGLFDLTPVDFQNTSA